MRKKSTTREVIHHVVSEPGDATRYEYGYFRDGDGLHVWPENGTDIGYPSLLPQYMLTALIDCVLNCGSTDVRMIANEDLFLRCASELKVNPHTLREVVMDFMGTES